MRTLSTVRFKQFTPALLRLLRAIYTVCPDAVITSANDGGHMAGSRHYTNEALDLRCKHLATEAEKRALAAALRAELGPAFTVLYEDPGGPNQHVHLQPKRGTIYGGPI